jgi:hypothetical protein
VQVLAFCTPQRPDWRWRIVDYEGGTVEDAMRRRATAQVRD